MGQVKALFDSNILVDFLQGSEAAREELNLYSVATISRITWMEVLIGARNEEEERLRLKFLADFETIELTASIARQAVYIRRSRRLKLPDAIILASAVAIKSVLVTRNRRDFPRDIPGVRIPY
jgi:predicted nucleic acid-binding protein